MKSEPWKVPVRLMEAVTSEDYGFLRGEIQRLELEEDSYQTTVAPVGFIRESIFWASCDFNEVRGTALFQIWMTDPMNAGEPILTVAGYRAGVLISNKPHGETLEVNYGHYSSIDLLSERGRDAIRLVGQILEYARRLAAGAVI